MIIAYPRTPRSLTAVLNPYSSQSLEHRSASVRALRKATIQSGRICITRGPDFTASFGTIKTASLENIWRATPIETATTLYKTAHYRGKCSNSHRIGTSSSVQTFHALANKHQALASTLKKSWRPKSTSQSSIRISQKKIANHKILK